MKNFSAALLSFLAANPAYMRADLFSITLKNGQIIRSTSSQVDLTYNGNIYYASPNGAWQRGKIVSEAGFDLRANDMSLTVLAPSTIAFPNSTVSLMGAAQLGLFDMAFVQVWTARWSLGQPPPMFGTSELASDTFVRANQNPINTNWQLRGVAGYQLGQVFGDLYIGQNGGDCDMLYGGIAWPPDQYSQGTIEVFNQGKGYATLCLRINASNSNGYVIVLDSFFSGGFGTETDLNIFSPSGKIAHTTIIPHAGDILRAQVLGTEITVYQNGIRVLSVTDTSVTSGSPGIASSPTSGVAGDIAWSDWSGGLVAMDVETKYAGYIKPNGSISRSKIEFEVADPLYLLNLPMPKHVIQANCRHTLYDLDEFALYGTRTNCTLNPASFSMNNSVAAGSSTQSINLATNANLAAPAYSQGYLLMTSGQNQGLLFSIKQQNGLTNLLLASKMPLPLAVGDTFTMYQGCDKSQATCFNKFNNLIHYGGQDYVPNPEQGI